MQLLLQVFSAVAMVSLNRLSVGCGTTPRRQSGYVVGFGLFIRVIYKMLPRTLVNPGVIFFINICKFVFIFILC